MTTILKEIINIICLVIFGEEVYNEGLNDEDLLAPPEPKPEPNQEVKPKFTEEDLKRQKKILLGALILFYIGLLLFFFDDSDGTLPKSAYEIANRSLFGSDSESDDK